jgi:hypothetical protein
MWIPDLHISLLILLKCQTAAGELAFLFHRFSVQQISYWVLLLPFYSYEEKLNIYRVYNWTLNLLGDVSIVILFVFIDFRTVLNAWHIGIFMINLFTKFRICLSIYKKIKHLSFYLWLYSPLVDLGRIFSSLILHTVGRTPWTEYQPVARPLHTHRTAQTQNKSMQTSMLQVGFESTIPIFERAKTVHALRRATTVIGPNFT